MSEILERKKNFIFLAVLILSLTAIFCVMFTTSNLASTLGISSYAAKKAIDIISAAGNIMSIIGLLGAVTGAGAIGAGLLFTAKKLIKRYGKRYAATW